MNIIRIKTIFAVISVLFIGAVLVADAENMLGAARKGIDVCLVTIIPSLFGFMVISAFVIESGLHKYIFKPFYVVLRHIIRLNEDEFAMLMLSLLGGYPVGAKLLGDYVAYNKNYHEIAPLRAPYMYCGSPAFIVSVVGISLYGSVKIGMLVYLSNVLSCILFAIFSNIANKKNTVNHAVNEVRINREVFISSVMSSGRALFIVCLIVVLFTILIAAAEVLGIFNAPGNILAPVAEISNIMALPKNNKALLPFIAALTSFGGLCIITQITAVVNGKFSLNRFFLLRIPIALLSGALCYFLTLGVDLPVSVNTNTYKVIPSGTANPSASVSLIIMVLLLILFISEPRGAVGKE